MIILFQPPFICSFQVAEYRIDIQQNGTNETFTIGREEYTYAESQSVRLRIPEHLVVNTEYVLTVTVRTIAGTSSFSTNFSEFRKLIYVEKEYGRIIQSTDLHIKSLRQRRCRCHALLVLVQWCRSIKNGQLFFPYYE